MVKITRLLIEAGDIVAFRVMCSQCKGEVLLSIKVGGQPLPSACAICGNSWSIGSNSNTEYWQTVRTVLSGLRMLLVREGDSIPFDARPFTVRIEVDGEAEEERES